MNNNIPLLKEFLSSEEGVLAYLKNLGKPNLVGLMFVEAAEDTDFWSALINTNERSFEILPASHAPQGTGHPANGKAALIKLYSYLHKRFLVGVDGDMDYACPLSTSDAQKLHDNPYIMHTFSYGMENVIYNEPFLRDVTEKIKPYGTDVGECNIISFLEEISEILYPTFLYFVILKEKLSPTPYCIKIFHDILTIQVKILTVQDERLSTPLKINPAYTHQIKEKCDHKNREMLHLIEEKNLDPCVEEYKEKIESLNIKKKNLYRFIPSHTLHKKLIYPILKEIHSIRKDKAITTIEHSNSSEKQKIDGKNNVNSHFEKKCNIETIIHCSKENRSYLQDDDEIIKKIKEKYESIPNTT